jgi:hypothetical protein
MDLLLMAEQISDYICQQRPGEVQCRRRAGIDAEAVARHIRQHMLAPNVRIADMMRHLLKLCETLRRSLERVDPDTGENIVDRGNVDTYLKVVTKVMDMYKMSETSKMLFAVDKAAAAAP